MCAEFLYLSAAINTKGWETTNHKYTRAHSHRIQNTSWAAAIRCTHIAKFVFIYIENEKDILLFFYCIEKYKMPQPYAFASIWKMQQGDFVAMYTICLLDTLDDGSLYKPSAAWVGKSTFLYYYYYYYAFVHCTNAVVAIFTLYMWFVSIFVRFGECAELFCLLRIIYLKGFCWNYKFPLFLWEFGVKQAHISIWWMQTRALALSKKYMSMYICFAGRQSDVTGGFEANRVFFWRLV